MGKFLPFILFLSLLYGQVVAQSTDTLRIQFQPVFGDLNLSLDWDMDWDGDPVSIETFRFYASGFSLWMEGDLVWSKGPSYHLVDAAGTSSLIIPLAYPADLEFNAVQFHLGIDSAANVAGVFGGDLDPTKGMYWAWNSGYINFKLEGTCPQSPARKNRFQYHLGGYLPPYQSLQVVELGADAVPILPVAIDLELFLGSLDISTQHTVMSPGPEGAQLSKLASTLFYRADLR